jgi:uncharacterized protein (TIGR03435 family)
MRMILHTVLLALTCVAASGQTPETKFEFEVASVKPAAPQGEGRRMMGMRGGPGTNDPGRITYVNLNLRDLVMIAYGVKRNQISGAPNWIDTDRFDITAKVPEGTTKEQANVMLQNLLADRFKLAVHREEKEMPAYALVIGKGGPKLKEVVPTPDATAPRPGDDPPPPPPPMGRLKRGKDGCPELPPGQGNRPNNFMMISPFGACMMASQQTMSGLADMLSNQFDRPVVDMTGLTGKYEYKLHFDPSSMGRGIGMPLMVGPPGGAVAPGGGPVPGGGLGAGGVSGAGGGTGGGTAAVPNTEPPETQPTIFAALQEQLGLKLAPKKAQVDLIVIDHVERVPTEN